MILVLDDDDLRLQRFRLYAPKATCVKTAKEMIDLLAKTKADLLFLDHDLNDETYVNSSREDCGMEVVRYITKNKPTIGQIIVHTHNPAASPIMVADLKKAGYNAVAIPFASLPWRNIRQAAQNIDG